jgi:hypothetical protein
MVVSTSYLTFYKIGASLVKQYPVYSNLFSASYFTTIGNNLFGVQGYGLWSFDFTTQQLVKQFPDGSMSTCNYVMGNNYAYISIDANSDICYRFSSASTTQIETLTPKNALNNKVFTIQPNPSRDFIKLISSGNKNSPLIINIYNINGQFVKTLSNATNYENIEIGVNDLKTGTYFIKTTSNELNETNTFIKIK